LITCYIGTRAQLIKMAPVLLEMERRNVPYRLVMTGQHQETMELLRNDFGLRTEPEHLHTGREITGILQMGLWFLRSLWLCLRQGPLFLPRSAPGHDLVLVHGDTMSTLLGALAARIRGVQVAQIEAGLRSGDAFHPFPEELTRLAVSRLATLAFCPGSWACANLAKYRSTVIDTQQNTLREALEIALTARIETEMMFDGQPFGIASIHRFENIFNKGRLREIITLVEQAASRLPIVFVLHPATRKRLMRSGLLSRLQANPHVHIKPRMAYSAFIVLANRARFVITDGGGNQEELYYLGVPTLLMRKVTERQEGLGSTATVGNYDTTSLERFLSSLPERGHPVPLASPAPSCIIVDHVQTYA
jgi:UDP-N-acetylglucosamine 2-epimerase (non-hydrolysing)